MPPIIADFAGVPTRVGQRSNLRPKASTESMIDVKLGKVGQSLLYMNQNFWNAPAPDLGVMHDQFHVYWIPNNSDQKTLLMDDQVESLDWSDGTPPTGYRTGSVTFRDHDAGPHVYPVKPGDWIALYVRDLDAKFKEWWRMRVMTPQNDYLSGTRTWELSSDVHRLFDSVAEFKYVKSSSHPQGWSASDVFRDIASTWGYAVPEKLPTFQSKLGTFFKITSPAEVLAKLSDLEMRQTGVRYLLSYEHGVLSWRKKQRSERMLLLGPLLIQAGYQASIQSGFATALHMRTDLLHPAQILPGGKRNTKGVLGDPWNFRAFVKDDAGVQRYGLVTKMGWVWNAGSVSRLTKYAIQHLAMVERPQMVISATHPGIPGLRPFDAVKVQVRTDPEIFQKVLFVNDVHFTVSSGQFDMTVTLSVDDPTLNLPDDHIYDTLSAAADARQRYLVRGRKHKPIPKKATQRATLGGTSTPVTEAAVQAARG